MTAAGPSPADTQAPESSVDTLATLLRAMGDPLRLVILRVLERDSFGVLELIAFLEDTFHISIDTARHELMEFDSVNQIVALVERALRPA